MTPSDARHGTSAGYVAGCREECCRRAIADWTRHMRTRRYLYGDLMVPAAATRRRVRALMALGWSATTIDHIIGRKRTYTIRMLGNKGTTCRRSTAEMYATVYDRLSMRLPPETTRYERQIAARNRTYARAQGWLPPLAYDDIEASVMLPKDAEPIGVDEAVVLRILAGDNVPSTRAEKVETMRRWLKSGRSEKSLCDQTGWQEGRYGATSVALPRNAESTETPLREAG